MAQKTFACTADARFVNSGGGAGSSLANPVGLFSGNVHRSAVKFALPDWQALGIRRITAATLKFRNSTEIYVTRGATPRMLVKRATSNWTEGGVNWANQPGTTTTGMVDTGTLATGNNTWVYIDVIALVRAWAPTTVEGGGGFPPYGFALHSFDEGSTTRTTEFHSRETASDPQLVIAYETNTAPSAPIDLSPGIDNDGAAVVAAITRANSRSLTVTFGGTAVDPDAGDYITGVRVQVYADSATDAVPGTAIKDETFTDFTGIPTTFSRAVSLYQLITPGTTYRGRYQTRDSGQAWGAWSSLTSSRFVPNTVPGAPNNLAVDPSSQTPTFFGTLVDADPGATIDEVFIEVKQDTAQGVVEKWSSGWVDSGGTRFGIAYSGGQPLEWDVQVAFRARIKDNLGSEGEFSAWVYWTPQEVFGANNMSPRSVETRLTTLTPTLTIAHSTAFDAYELEVARNSDGSELLWDVGPTVITSTTSKDVTYAGGTLQWGGTRYWRTKIRVAGVTWTEWGPWFPFYLNALPLAPVISLSDGLPGTARDAPVSPSGKPIPPSPATYVTTASLTPVLTSPFVDADVAKGYAEAPIKKFITMQDRTTWPPVPVAAYWPGGSQYQDSALTDTHTIIGGALTFEHQYIVQVLWKDSANQLGPWSDWFAFKVSAPPVVSAGTAVDNTDPAPTIDWAWSSPSGKGQLRYQVQVYENVSGKLIHDSGLVDSSASDYTVPGGLLSNAIAYRALVTAYDTDLVWDDLAVSPWTTSFSTPSQLTGLTATPDLDASAVVLAWDVTSLSDAHFWRYLIDRRNEETGEYERIGEVTAKGTLTYTDKEAPHGVTVSYAVSVSNGWADSEVARITTLMELEWWIVTPTDPSLTFPVRWFEGFSDLETNEQETFSPLGRAFPIVVSGELLAPAGHLMVKLLPGDPDRYRSKLRQVARIDPWVVLKSPSGDVRRVKVGSIDRDMDFYGTQVVGFDWQAVA